MVAATPAAGLTVDASAASDTVTVAGTIYGNNYGIFEQAGEYAKELRKFFAPLRNT